MPRQDHDDLNGNPKTKREHPSDSPRRPRSAVGTALLAHEEEIAHCEALYAATMGEVTDEIEAAEARRDLSARQALEALAHHRRYLADRTAAIQREREALDRLQDQVDKRIEWNEARTADLAETVAPGRTRVEIGVRVVKIRRTVAVVTGEGFDPEALPDAWCRRKPERVIPASVEIDKAAAKADLLLGYREGEPPCSGWYDVEGHGRVWLDHDGDEAWWLARVWPGPCKQLALEGLSIEPEPGLDVLRWRPSPPGITLERRTHVTVE